MNATIPKFLLTALLLSLSSGCGTTNVDREQEHKTAAERFFRGVYGGDPSVVDELAAKDIVISYPIFQTLFNSPVLVGKDAVREFVDRFGTKWKDPNATIHEVVAEGDTVVLVWSFSAHDASFDPSSEATVDPEKRWGGITVFRFNQEGKIVSEFGEESEPGPIGRLSESDPTE